MEYEMKEVAMVTTGKDTLDNALRELSGDAFKLLIAASLLKLTDWTTVIPEETFNATIHELVDKGVFFTNDWKLFSIPDFCERESVELCKFIK